MRRGDRVVVAGLVVLALLLLAECFALFSLWAVMWGHDAVHSVLAFLLFVLVLAISTIADAVVVAVIVLKAVF